MELIKTVSVERDKPLHCPICDCSFTHVVGIGSDLGGTGRRLNAYVDMTCESGGHEFTLTLHQHRGRTSLIWSRDEA